METCRDYPQLSEVAELINFAENAYTSADMLRNNYLKKIDRTASAKRARNIFKEDVIANKTIQERAKDLVLKRIKIENIFYFAIKDQIFFCSKA